MNKSVILLVLLFSAIIVIVAIENNEETHSEEIQKATLTQEEILENEILIFELQKPQDLLHLLVWNENEMISFIWEDKYNRSFSSIALPPNKIKVKIVEHNRDDTVQFFLNSSIKHSDSNLKQLYFSDKKEFFGKYLDYVLMICNAKENCPEINN